MCLFMRRAFVGAHTYRFHRDFVRETRAERNSYSRKSDLDQSLELFFTILFDFIRFPTNETTST